MTAGTPTAAVGVSTGNRTFWTIGAAGIALALVYLIALRGGQMLAVFWIVGLGFGVTLQRSRFCFASAFRDLFLLHAGRNMRGVLVGLAVATAGFAMVMGTVAPQPGAFGGVPADAHVLPLGPATVIGGLLFGFGMVVAGGCVSGMLYRMGEGYVASWVTLAGLLLGLLALNHTWNWWWEHSIQSDALVWLPTTLGYTGSLVLTGAGLLAAFVGVLWWERRGRLPVSVPIHRAAAEPDAAPSSLGDELRALWRRIAHDEWSILVGGLILGGLNVLLFVRYRPLGVVGEISRWSTDLSGLIGAAPGPLLGVGELAGCVPLTEGGSWFTAGFMLNAGLIAGSFTAALLANEFRLRLPRRRSRYVQSFGGGVIMGYGAGLAVGCTIGAFFSAIPSLALNGWIFAVALTAGAYVGVQAIRRMP